MYTHFPNFYGTRRPVELKKDTLQKPKGLCGLALPSFLLYLVGGPKSQKLKELG